MRLLLQRDSYLLRSFYVVFAALGGILPKTVLGFLKQNGFIAIGYFQLTVSALDKYSRDQELLHRKPCFGRCPA